MTTDKENQQVPDSANESQEQEFSMEVFKEQVFSPENKKTIMAELQAIRDIENDRTILNTDANLHRAKLKKLGFNSKMIQTALNLLNMEHEQFQKTILTVDFILEETEEPYQLSLIESDKPRLAAVR